MEPITLSAFLGANLAADPLELPPGVGVDSQNLKPGYGDFRTWKAPSTVATVPTGSQRLTIYRMGQDVASDANYWLSWNTVVNAVRGYDAPDPTERTYFSGSGTPKWTDNVIGLAGGAPYPQGTRELAVPAPTIALTASIHAAGTGTAVVTSYVYTWVNDLGWESAPSPVSNELTTPPTTTVNLTGFDAVPAGNYGINKVRIYKIQTSSAGVASFFFLRDLVYGAGLVQPIDDARAVGSDELETVGWLPPDSTFFGLTKMWNGMLCMLTDKAARICEPYKPYAYPLKYEVALNDQPVAAGVYGQKMLILTAGDVYMAVGSVPEAIDSQPLKIYQPCSSARGMVEFSDGIAWPSPNGLNWYSDATGHVVVTADLLERDQWQALVPSTMVASRYLNYYICSYNDGSGLKGFVIDPHNPTGIYWLSAGFNAVFRDPLTDNLYVLNVGNVQKWNTGAALTGTFLSKIMRQPAPVNFGAVEVIASSYPVTLSLYADGSLFHTQAVTSDTPIRPPPGNEAEQWQVKLQSSGRITAVRLALSVDDLRNA